jgi:3-hydroxyacyl-CoA dehydrogenase
MRRDGNVAIITIDNPPVNALRQAVRAGIKDCVIAARDDASVEAIILTGAGRTFVAGADITEFGKPPQPPGLMEVITILDDVKKPTIAAVQRHVRSAAGSNSLWAAISASRPPARGSACPRSSLG